ncbi:MULTISPECIES: L-histidine N(alpha)-methyltransferase [Hyphobacterium]|uniref:L-histidine N(Alpha)-methyltransferase n=1 Tax=Hyphobacterium vulgare TaxID=1736751 RepID=A0ABV6ZW17_9PROT
MTETATAFAPDDPLDFFIDLHPPVADFRSDVLSGLRDRPRTIPPKYFYDADGSALFDAITTTPEYYVTRTELSILERIAPEIAARAGRGAVVIEPGSGSSVKITTLLRALDRPKAYIGSDISKQHLVAACRDLAAEHPGLFVGAVCADFTVPLDLSELDIPDGRRLVFFPGSTIGNFEPAQAVQVLKNIRSWLRPGDALLLGADRIKDRAVLQAAYDDAGGVTAAFNLNLLKRIARELDSDIEPADFRHRAIWNAEKARIEMHLEARRDIAFSVAGERFEMRKGETIHTENSHKFSVESFMELAGQAGLMVRDTWSDPAEHFTLYWLERGREA